MYRVIKTKEGYEMAKQNAPTTFNDKMVKKTALPAIYLWLLASAAVVGMGIYKPDIVLANLDGFIALIAIIGGIAAPAMNTILRMWESEQAIEIQEMPAEMIHERERDVDEHIHRMAVEKHREGMGKDLACIEESCPKMLNLDDLEPKKSE